MTDAVPWLRSSRWPTVPIKRVARLGTGHTPSRQQPEYWRDCTIPWITLADVWQLRGGRTQVITDTAEMISALGLASSAAVQHQAGSVILSRTASVGFSAIMGSEMATSQDFAVWTCGPQVLPRFLLHVLRAMEPDLKRLAAGTTHQTIYMPDLAALRTPLPPVEQQTRIADLLDAEIARINSLSGRLDAVAERLHERRLGQVYALVTGAARIDKAQATTLPWAEELPSAWPVVKLNYVARQGSGHTPSRARPEWWTDCHIPWITTGEVHQVRDDRREVVSETRESISDLGLANSSAELHRAGTVVLCRTAASAGYSAVMGTDMATSQDFATWTCDPRLDPHYLLWCLRAMRPDLLGRLAMGSTHKTIYMPDIQTIRIPLPTMEEQRDIVAEIKVRNEGIDGLLDRLDHQRLLLGERRQAVITAAVTGQLDLPATTGAA